MGGVYADKEPITMPPVPDILNRFSSATMNQLYHPQCTASFFAFLAKWQIPSFVIPNNAVKYLTTMDAEGKEKTYDGVEKFLITNDLNGDFLQKLTRAHYTSTYNPPRKPYDYFAAKALTTWLESGNSGGCSPSHERFLFYSNVYGMAYVSRERTWEETRDSYIRSICTEVKEDDTADVKSKKEYFVKEINILKGIEYAGMLSVNEVRFACDNSTFHVQIANDSEK